MGAVNISGSLQNSFRCRSAVGGVGRRLWLLSSWLRFSQGLNSSDSDLEAKDVVRLSKARACRDL